jgi:hypothetical protein
LEERGYLSAYPIKPYPSITADIEAAGNSVLVGADMRIGLQSSSVGLPRQTKASLLNIESICEETPETTAGVV